MDLHSGLTERMAPRRWATTCLIRAGGTRSIVEPWLQVGRPVPRPPRITGDQSGKGTTQPGVKGRLSRGELWPVTGPPVACHGRTDTLSDTGDKMHLGHRQSLWVRLRTHQRKGSTTLPLTRRDRAPGRRKTERGTTRLTLLGRTGVVTPSTTPLLPSLSR